MFVWRIFWYNRYFLQRSAQKWIYFLVPLHYNVNLSPSFHLMRHPDISATWFGLISQYKQPHNYYKPALQDQNITIFVNRTEPVHSLYSPAREDQIKWLQPYNPALEDQMELFTLENANYQTIRHRRTISNDRLISLLPQSAFTMHNIYC